MNIGIVFGGPPNIEVLTAASNFKPVIAPSAGELRNFFEREIGPLAGEKRYWASHFYLR